MSNAKRLIEVDKKLIETMGAWREIKAEYKDGFEVGSELSLIEQKLAELKDLMGASLPSDR